MGREENEEGVEALLINLIEEREERKLRRGKF